MMRATCVMGSIRIDRRAHASFDASFLSRRLPRAATMVRARSSPRHRLFRHIATARPTGSSEPTPSPIAPRDASSARIGFDRVGHRESASATRAPLSMGQLWFCSYLSS